MIRDPRTILLTIVMPLVLLLLFGFAISMEVNEIRVAVSLAEPGQQANALVSRLSSNPYIRFVGAGPENRMEPLLREGKADAAVIFRPDADRVRAIILVDASNPSIARSYSAYISGILNGNAISSAPVISHILFNPQLKSSYNFVPGILGMIFILICSIMTSVSIVREKESGTMSLMMVSPVRANTVIIGKLIPYLALSCIILALMLTVSYTVLGIPISITMRDVIFLSLIYISLALALGLLISSLVDTQLNALIVSSLLFMFPVIMLSGMIFPVQNMPDVLQWISCIVPARWYVDAMRKLMIERLPLSYVATELTILSGMTLGLLALAVTVFKRKY